MSREISMFRIALTLLFAVFLAVPQTMIAQDGVVNTGSEVTSPASPEATDPETGDTDSGDTGTGDEGDVEEGDSGTGDGDGASDTGDGNADDGNADSGEPDTNGDQTQGPESDSASDPGFSILAEQGTGDPAFYCDFGNLTSGSVDQWWAANDVAPDCIDLTITNSPATCSLTATFASHVVLANGTYTDSLTWYETDANGVVLREGGGNFPAPVLNMGSTGPVGSTGGSFTVSFDEDYNGGTAYILINFGSPESDIAPGLEQIDLDHWRTTSAGVVYEINTDCELPAEGFYCDYANHTGAGSVYSWLASAPEGANTDCIDVGEIDYGVCGQVTVPITEIVEPWDYVIEYVEGTDLSSGTAVVAAGGVISFPEDYNGGSVTVTAYIGGSEQDWVAFANEGDWAYAEGGVQIVIDTDCIPNIPVPELPVPIQVEACQVSYAGATTMTSTNGVTERVKVDGDENGEVNADGWGTTMRLYAATRDDLTNVSITWTAVGGGDFGADYNTLQSPGAGALVGAGYDQAAAGYTVTVSGNTITATVASMPANSSLSFNIPVTFAEGQTAMYVHSWMTGDLVDCAPAVLDLPTITASVCDDNNMPTPVSVTAPANSESVTYGDVTATVSEDGLVFTLIATVNPGYTLDGATAPAGWTVVSDTEATYTSEPLALAECEVPLEVVAPEVPELIAATCGDEDDDTALPSLVIPETEGVTYGEVEYSPANSVKMTLTATTNEGFTFAGAELPEGWTLVNSSEAVYEIVADTVDCSDDETPTTPDPKTPEVTKLPETGAGTSSISTIGLAASAAAALAGAGLFINNRRR